jgi:hypothetical protein
LLNVGFCCFSLKSVRLCSGSNVTFISV